MTKFRAYNPATGYWYDPTEVFVSNGNTYLDDEDFEGLTQNNDVDLMQSTGLFDSSLEPVEIYKDDVVKRVSIIPGGKDLVGVVKMLEGCWVIDDGKQAISLWTEVDKNIVIGNVHQHPELVAG